MQSLYEGQGGDPRDEDTRGELRAELLGRSFNDVVVRGLAHSSVKRDIFVSCSYI